MSPRVGILLVNLGTPDSAKPRAVKRYLTQFLTDGRVIDIPFFLRQLLVRGVIIPKRYRNSAKLYQAIWKPEGSPLKIYSYELKDKLQEALGNSFQVELAMRYQTPSIETGLENLRSCQKIVLIPLFPQYASATTGSVYQEVFRILQTWEVIPSLVCMDGFATHEEVIHAFCQAARQYDLAQYDHFLFSYHGLPERQVQKADRCHHCLKTPNCCQELTDKNRTCYAAQCVATTAAICRQLKLPQEAVSHCYQSRLGKDPWIQPYASNVLEKLAKEGKKKILVFSPAFVADCLETLQEIGIEYQAEFKQWGGEKLDLVEGLNARPEWVSALKSIILTQLPSKERNECTRSPNI
ncbi:ferrochelatase [Simkania negevensis]|uniref:Ferrochelatase n=1 Tax=Simkania negevensis (strain ATCC VR-1471 / DSM 27360 / Z) TaxID=331113 RepID=F8L8V7_SIMNZ|nr:ferrochelatase [Simkania negevensis]CCB89250.1 ferrochelatase [Simkania negevensis Z]